jgi:NitT/TauT family transport system permease protein
LATSGRALAGLCVAAVSAAVLLLIVALYPILWALAKPTLIMLKAAPAVAFAPLLVGLLHSGNTVKVIIAALISFFPIVVGGVEGVRQAPEPLVSAWACYGGGRMGRMRVAQLGYLLNGFFSGLLTAAPLSVVGAIVAEFVDASASGSPGVGIYIANHARGLYMTHVSAGIVCAATIGIAFFTLTSMCATVVCDSVHIGK